MLNVLHEVEKELSGWLRTAEGWMSLDVSYHPPRVERLWRQWQGYRVYLHAIHPCRAEDALFHPHPWPSAMRVLSGHYEMGVGYGKGDAVPPVAARLVASGNLEYEMTDENAWHYVRPLDGMALTIMVTGEPWQRSSPKSTQPLRPLPASRVEELLAQFRGHL